MTASVGTRIEELRCTAVKGTPSPGSKDDVELEWTVRFLSTYREVRLRFDVKPKLDTTIIDTVIPSMDIPLVKDATREQTLFNSTIHSFPEPAATETLSGEINMMYVPVTCKTRGSAELFIAYRLKGENEPRELRYNLDFEIDPK